jgi:nucleoside 2-deoxyribosyltransferase
MKIFVIGPVSYKRKGKEMRKLVKLLKTRGLDVFSVFDSKFDSISDYRHKRSYAKKVYKEAEKFIQKKADILVADLRGPSDGRTLEQFLAHKYNKPVIGYAPTPVRSPWSVLHVNEIATSIRDLLKIIGKYSKKIESKNTNTFYKIFQIRKRRV